MSTDQRPHYDDLVRAAAEAADEVAQAERALAEAEARLEGARDGLTDAQRAIRAYIAEDVDSLRATPDVGVEAIIRTHEMKGSLR